MQDSDEEFVPEDEGELGPVTIKKLREKLKKAIEEKQEYLDGWQRSRVTALFANESLAREAAELLVAQEFFDGCQVLAMAPVPEQDWVRLTQSQFTPVDITPEFWIVPTWHELPAEAKRSIRLDPGLAFGTGTHPTTRMCLRWIARNGATESSMGNPLGRVLDYGCGSGILAIGAAKFGATDIDADATVTITGTVRITWAWLGDL